MSKLRILAFGAHPDDCDIKAGGVATLYRQLGHDVRFVSVTNGESGHQTDYGKRIANRRLAEAKAAGDVVGLQYDVLPFRDGHLEPNISARLRIISIIRGYKPDLILTHRPNDYHPDHRYTSQLVCDAAYMVTVPALAPEVPALQHDPVIMYMWDEFRRPYPFSPDVAVDIEPVVETVVDMLECHQSQFYDWLPYNRGELELVPSDPAARRQWLKEWYFDWITPLADQHRDLLISTYGDQRGRAIRHIEAFECCEYGAPLTDENRRRLFPFLP